VVAFAAPVLANPFSDVPFSHWAYDAVKQLTEKGIMTGMPDGTFKGDKGVSRYEMAVTLARTLDKMGSLKGKVDATDIKTLEKLTVEFADELALLGVKVTALEDELQTVRDDIAVLKADVAGGHEGACGSCGIKMTGDAKITIDNVKYENDVVAAGLPKDDMFTYYQIGFNFAAPIDEDISTFIRVVNDDVIGNQFDNIEDQRFGIDLAYIDVKKFFELGDIRVGRQFAKLGHSIVLDDKFDAISFCKDIEDLKVMFMFSDEPAGAAKNGFNLKALDLKYAFDEHAAEFYYLQNSFAGAPGMDPVTYGLALDGGLIEKVDYMLEYAKYDPDVVNGVKGTALLGGLAWDFTEKLGVELMYGKGDEEFVPTSIYTHHHLKDMFGRMDAGVLPQGTNLASGSLNGIKDIFVKLGAELTEKTDGCLVYEKAEANDSSAVIANAQEYKRLTLGLDHQYAPNTVFGVRYDTVEYDVDAVNTAQNAGGWNRIRVEMSVKF
jgi:hypothetical protein